MKRVIIIMAKVPRAGNVKTRLQPFLTPEKCRSLAEAFLSDAIRKTREICDQMIIAYAPAGEEEYFALFNLENAILIPQQGARLGDKMNNAFKFAFNSFSDANVLMIGTDSPTVPADYLEEAFTALEGKEEKAELILGKADDGGFYAIGLHCLVPDLFENIEWSTPHVYQQTKRNSEKLKIALQSIPDWYDVDTEEDLLILCQELLRGKKARIIAPETYKWLLANQELFESDTHIS